MINKENIEEIISKLENYHIRSIELTDGDILRLNSKTLEEVREFLIIYLNDRMDEMFKD